MLNTQITNTIINNSMKPVAISLWAEYSDQDATEIGKLQGPFPIVLGTRLRLSPYYGKFQLNISDITQNYA